jgi:long-chain acyl-CoA synthetase
VSENIWDRRLGFWYIAEDQPDAPAIMDSPDGEWTYGELAAAAHQLVHTFRAQGVPDDGIVAILAPNGVWPILVSLACQEAGWNLLLVNSYLTSPEIVRILDHSGADLLVMHEEYAGLLAGQDGGGIPSMTTVLGVGEVPGVPSLEQLRLEQPTTPPENRREGGFLAYSSGTTGAPKGILRVGSGRDPSKATHQAAILGRAFDFRPFEGPQLVSTAMYHGGSNTYYMGALNVGHALVIMRRFEAEGALALIDRFGVRSAYMVPTQFHRMLRLPAEVRDKYDVSTLHSVVHSAAPCPMAVKQAMMDWWGPVVWETYGGMEGAATIAKPHHWLAKPGTVGRPVRGVRVAIFDDGGNELGPDEPGHIYMATQAGFSYHRDEELTSQAHRDDMFTIGDIGYLDEDGFLFVQDRAKDMIISGGVNIFPAEIEAVLAPHEAVADVAVIGIPDEEWGEQVLAVVELSEGFEPTTALVEELLEYCADHLAAYKRPRRIEFRASLPRTDAGKLYKRQIRDEFWQDATRKV